MESLFQLKITSVELKVGKHLSMHPLYENYYFFFYRVLLQFYVLLYARCQRMYVERKERCTKKMFHHRMDAFYLLISIVLLYLYISVVATVKSYIQLSTFYNYTFSLRGLIHDINT